MNEIIQVNNISFHYPERKRNIFDGLSLTVKSGEWLAVIGHNGSGKSTLAKVIDGLLLPQKGTVAIDGQELTSDNIWQIRQKIGVVFQNPDNQFVGADVESDVAFGMENLGVPREEMHRKVKTALQRVGMEAFAKRDPSRLSGGQKQRVAIAGVLTLTPEIVIFDEATSMLDPEGRHDVLQLIKQLNAQGLTIISITHDIDEAAEADRIVVLDDGKVVADNIPEEVFLQGEELIHQGLDLPYPEKLKTALKRQGIAVPHEYLTEKGLADWLWQSYSKI